MAITKIKVSNFKSFDELEVDLRPLNIVVGGNAAGKSNFLEIFRFIRDLAAHGLENAVSLQGGMEYLANLRIKQRRSVSLRVELESVQEFYAVSSESRAMWQARTFSTTYVMAFSVEADGVGLTVTEDCIFHDCDFIDSRTKKVTKGQVRLYRIGPLVRGEYCYSGSFMDNLPVRGFLEPLMVLPKEELAPGELLIDKGLHPIPSLPSALALFDFDPKLPKRAIPVTGKADLEPDGSNLALVLRTILREKDKREPFIRLLKDSLPFVQDLKVDRFADQSLLLALKERYSDQSYLPASFLSDGTIHLTALILALYFDKAPVTIIEEPERNIHPHLISKVVGMMKDASRQKQIIATTHNPEVVKNADLEDLLLVQRDENGFSRISRPAESEELKVFLENDLGVDELYVQDLLGVGRAV